MLSNQNMYYYGGGVRLLMQKNQNGKWMELNLMYQEDPDAIKE